MSNIEENHHQEENQQGEQLKDLTFEELGLDPRLIRALTKKNIENPTPIQQTGIPLILEGKDVVARAKTGSGKTFAYLLPLIQKLLSDNSNNNASSSKALAPTAMILVPSRELCQQVYSEVLSLIELCRVQLKVVQLTGEPSFSDMAAALAGPPHILVSTPACVQRCLSSGVLKATSIQDSLSILVLDEADLLFTYGYEKNLKDLKTHIPIKCQCLLMSATSSDDVESLKKLYLHNPYILTLPEVGDAKDEIVPKNVQQFWIQCSDRDKLLHILALLKLDLVQKKVLIFTNTIDTGFRLKLFLEQFGIKSAVLNAELPINSRVHILEDDYQHEMIKKYGPDTSTHPLGDIEIWERCVGGRKRGRMFGVGTSMDPSYVITGLLSGSSTGKSYAGSSSSEVQELKEKLQKIEEERAIEREENARREEENMDLIYVAMLARQYPPPPSDDPTSRDPPFFRQDDMDLIYVSLVIPFSVV